MGTLITLFLIICNLLHVTDLRWAVVVIPAAVEWLCVVVAVVMICISAGRADDKRKE